MRISYRYALLSFCVDLTSPNARSVPLAVVGVGDGFMYFAVRARPGDDPAIAAGDETTRAMLNDLPSLLQRQLTAGQTEVPPEQLLSWLHGRFRTSLHVSAIKEREADIAAPRDIVTDGFALYAEAVRGVRTTQRPEALQRADEDDPAFGYQPVRKGRARSSQERTERFANA
jgi:hypothetical protein